MEHNYRRDFLRIALAGTAAVATLSAFADEAEAYQGNMERALSSLYSALSDLREASGNKGGHRSHAIELVRQAIDETQAGVEYSADH